MARAKTSLREIPGTRTGDPAPGNLFNFRRTDKGGVFDVRHFYHQVATRIEEKYEQCLKITWLFISGTEITLLEA